MGDGKVECLKSDLDIALTYDDEGNLSITKDENDEVAKYVVSVYTYVNAYAKMLDGSYVADGTNRYGVQRSYSADEDLSNIDVKYLGVCDYPSNCEELEFEENAILDESTGSEVWIAKYNGQKYYWIDREAPYFESDIYAYYYFVDTPTTCGAKATPDIATLAAYSSDGTLIGLVEATPETGGGQE